MPFDSSSTQEEKQKSKPKRWSRSRRVAPSHFHFVFLIEYAIECFNFSFIPLVSRRRLRLLREKLISVPRQLVTRTTVQSCLVERECERRLSTGGKHTEQLKEGKVILKRESAGTVVVVVSRARFGLKTFLLIPRRSSS